MAPLLSSFFLFSWVNIYHSCLILSIYNSNKYTGVHIQCTFTVYEEALYRHAQYIPNSNLRKIRSHQHYLWSPFYLGFGLTIDVTRDVTPESTFILIQPFYRGCNFVYSSSSFIVSVSVPYASSFIHIYIQWDAIPPHLPPAAESNEINDELKLVSTTHHYGNGVQLQCYLSISQSNQLAFIIMQSSSSGHTSGVWHGCICILRYMYIGIHARG